MRTSIREMLDRKRREMEEKSHEGNMITLSDEQFQQLLGKLGGAQEMNPLEKKRYETEMATERRAAMAQAQLAKSAADTERNRVESCTHSTDLSGNAAPRGQGRWCTQGQLHGNDTASLVCMRCGKSWTWFASPADRETSLNGPHGLLWYAPPADEMCVVGCTYCNKFVTKKDMPEHEAECKKSLEALVSI